MSSVLKFTKVSSVDGFTVLVLCISSDDALYLYKALRKYLKGLDRYWVDTISKVFFFFKTA